MNVGVYSTRIEDARSIGGVLTEAARIDLASGISNLDVFLIGRPGTHTVTAYYDVNTTGTMTPLGSAIAVPAAWFATATASTNASLTGLMVSHGTAARMAFVYDFFRIDRSVP